MVSAAVHVVDGSLGVRFWCMGSSHNESINGISNFTIISKLMDVEDFRDVFLLSGIFEAAWYNSYNFPHPGYPSYAVAHLHMT